MNKVINSTEKQVVLGEGERELGKRRKGLPGIRNLLEADMSILCPSQDRRQETRES